MKYLISLSFALFSINALIAQIPGASAVANSYASEGTTLALTTRLHTTVSHWAIELNSEDMSTLFMVTVRLMLQMMVGFTTSGDVDFLSDFSPVTGEVHLQASTEDVGLEQLFGRYSFNQDFISALEDSSPTLAMKLMKLQVYFLHLMDI